MEILHVKEDYNLTTYLVNGEYYDLTMLTVSSWEVSRREAITATPVTMLSGVELEDALAAILETCRIRKE